MRTASTRILPWTVFEWDARIPCQNHLRAKKRAVCAETVARRTSAMGARNLCKILLHRRMQRARENGWSNAAMCGIMKGEGPGRERTGTIQLRAGGNAMNYTNDAYVTMLLSMALSPNREEYARPLSTQELKQLEDRVRACGMHHIGRLMNIDIGGLMIQLDISEEEAYRIYTLLNRSVQLSYTVENYLHRGIEVVTCYNGEYPQRLKRRMEYAAPPVFYRCGNQELLDAPMLAIVGISGVKTSPEVRDSIETLVRNGVRLGYTILTGGELGVSRVAMNLTSEYGGNLVEVLGGDMMAHIQEEGVAELLAANRAAVLSLEHPEALFTVSHAIARNKLLFSLAEAAFIFNTDGKRGEMDAIRNRYCDWIYAWTGCAHNQALIARGAIPVKNVLDMDLGELSPHWRNSQSEQINIFDLFD